MGENAGMLMVRTNPSCSEMYDRLDSAEMISFDTRAQRSGSERIRGPGASCSPRSEASAFVVVSRY